MPVGPQILWPEYTRKSQPMVCTSKGMCPALWAASTSVMMPRLRARSHSSATGLTVPIEFEMWTIAKIFTCLVSNESSWLMSSRASSPLTGR